MKANATPMAFARMDIPHIVCLFEFLTGSISAGHYVTACALN